MKPFLQQTTDK